MKEIRGSGIPSRPERPERPERPPWYLLRLGIFRGNSDPIWDAVCEVGFRLGDRVKVKLEVKVGTTENHPPP